MMLWMKEMSILSKSYFKEREAQKNLRLVYLLLPSLSYSNVVII